MRHILLVFVLMVLVCCGTSVFAQDNFCSVEVPGQVFCEDFSDGDAQDGMPVTWTEGPNQDGFDATSGDYVVTATTNDHFKFSTVVDEVLTDVSIRTQVRTSSVEGGAFLSARLLDPLALPSPGNYFGGIKYDPNLGGTHLILGRSDGGNFTFFGGNPVLPFDVRTEDAVLQLDVIGNELKLWGWKAGDPMPDQPQVSATDNNYSGGAIRIVNDNHNLNVATFRYVQVATQSIPEPSTAILSCLGFVSLIAWRRKKPSVV